MADLDGLIVPDWMKDIPAPAPPTHHTEKAPEPKYWPEQDLSAEDSDEEDAAVEHGVQLEQADVKENVVEKEESEPKKVEVPANSDDEDQTPFEMVSYLGWKSKEKDPDAPAEKKKEPEATGRDRVVIIKGKAPVQMREEPTPVLESKENIEPEATGDPQKAGLQTPPSAPKPKTKNNKKFKKLILTDPVENEYVRPTSKVAAKYSKVAAVNAATKAQEKDSTPTNTAATLTKLKSEQDAIIRKKKAKVAAMPEPLKRAVQAKKREAELERDRQAAEERAAYELENPPPPPAEEQPIAPGAFPAEAEPTPTRLQKAFEAMQKGEVRPAIDMVAYEKVRKYLPKNTKEDKELLWKVVKWAFAAFALFIFYELHIA